MLGVQQASSRAFQQPSNLLAEMPAQTAAGQT